MTCESGNCTHDPPRGMTRDWGWVQRANEQALGGEWAKTKYNLSGVPRAWRRRHSNWWIETWAPLQGPLGAGVAGWQWGDWRSERGHPGKSLPALVGCRNPNSPVGPK